MKDLHEYEDMIEDMFKNPEKIVYDIEKNEYYYIRGDDLLRVKENGDFVSMYRGANSDRVTKAIEEGGIVWQK